MKIEELGYQKTRLGDLTLRRRPEPLLGNIDVFEVKLGDEYLMSSLFTKSEQQLATLGLSNLKGELDVVIGGLGLGYTAAEALKNQSVRSLLVIDLFQPVIDWHNSGLIPMSSFLTNDLRCELRQGDFFALAVSGLDKYDRQRKFDAILVDIDHSPEHYLDPENKSLYATDGLTAIKRQLRSGGVFAIWSNDCANNEFNEHLRSVFGTATAHDIEFPNPYTGSTSVNSVYVAVTNGDE